MKQKEPLESRFNDSLMKAAAHHKGKDKTKGLLKFPDKIIQIDKKIAELIQKEHFMYNWHWGPLMRAGNEESYFASQVERYACIYMPTLKELLSFSPSHHFRAVRVPHASRAIILTYIKRKIK